MFRQGIGRQLGWGISITGLILVIDLFTKGLADQFRDEPLELLGRWLTLVYTENSGASFSLLQGQGTLLALVAIGAIVLLMGALLRPRQMIEVAAFGMLAGGAAGNLANRITRGEGLFDGRVVDWIRFPNFPDFNLADTAITFGVIILFWSAWMTSSREETSSLSQGSTTQDTDTFVGSAGQGPAGSNEPGVRTVRTSSTREGSEPASSVFLKTGLILGIIFLLNWAVRRRSQDVQK